MSKNVQIPYQKMFLQPRQCVACGDSELGEKKLPRSLSKEIKLTWKHSRIETINMDFPLCDRCDMSFRKYAMKSLMIFLGGLLLTVMLFLNILGSNILLGFIVFLIGIFTSIFLFIREWKKESAEIDYDRKYNVINCVQILDFNVPQYLRSNDPLLSYDLYRETMGTLYGEGFVKISFSNDVFAQEFAKLNKGFTFGI